MSYNDTKLYFTHAPDGTPMGILYQNLAYFYITNLQGDVVGIVDSLGNPVVAYTYDAWGNVLSCTGTMADTLGTINPIRYRGYVYDAETGLYYLQSRYYDPELGRFINADAFTATGQGFTGNNMFAYCGNNPVGYEDEAGSMRKPTTIAINDGGNGDALKQALGIAYSLAYSIGYSSDVSEGTISIDLDKNMRTINYLNSTMYLSMEVICSEIARGAGQKYYNTFGVPFLLSDDCIAGEVYDHVIAYQWSIDQKILPNLIAFAFYIKTDYSATNVYNATRFTDIRESDVIAGGNWYSQAELFSYKEGIRDCYIGTNRDPWKNMR